MKINDEINSSQIFNMWVSDNYVSHWGFKEGIREFIQNQYDGMIIKIGDKNNLNVEKIEKKNGINDFKFYKKLIFDKKEYYGGITYNNFKEKLTIWNKGTINKVDFLFGSLKQEMNNQDIIGRYGEGMKLGFLALNRLNKNVKIISEKKIFDFYIGKDNNFIQDNKSLNCLFCKISQYNKEDMKDKIKVEIENVK